MAHRYDDRYERDMYRDRGYARDERGLLERAGDEVRSWFGDEEAERRRRLDERERARRGYSDRGWTGERWEEPDRWRAEPGRWRSEADRWRDDTERREYDRSGAAYRGWNDPEYGYRPAEGYGYGGSEWRARRGSERRGIYEDDRGRVHQFSHGQFAGRGPKGYRRSDERVREDVCDRLTDDPSIDASDMEIAVNNGEVTLSGVVHSRAEKRHAEDLIDGIAGVRDVHNNLRVSRWDEPQTPTSTPTPAASPRR